MASTWCGTTGTAPPSPSASRPVRSRSRAPLAVLCHTRLLPICASLVWPCCVYIHDPLSPPPTTTTTPQAAAPSYPRRRLTPPGTRTGTPSRQSTGSAPTRTTSPSPSRHVDDDDDDGIGGFAATTHARRQAPASSTHPSIHPPAYTRSQTHHTTNHAHRRCRSARPWGRCRGL